MHDAELHPAALHVRKFARLFRASAASLSCADTRLAFLCACSARDR